MDIKINEYLYAIGSPNESLIHIGHSNNQNQDFKRLNEQLINSPFGAYGGEGRSELLAIWRGTYGDEQAIGRYFKPHRFSAAGLESRIEIYRSGAVIPYIAFLRTKYSYVAISLDEYKSRCRNIVGNPSEWLPSSDRIADIRPEIKGIDNLGQHFIQVLLSERKPWCIFEDRYATSEDFYSPISLHDPIRQSLGGVIELDPCSDYIANEYVRAQKIFTVHNSGLNQDWFGGVWLSPPFNQWGEWARKALNEWHYKRVREIVAIVGARQAGNDYMKDFISGINALCYPYKRLTWWGHAGPAIRKEMGQGKKKGTNAEESHIITYTGPNVDRFREAFNYIGNTFRR